MKCAWVQDQLLLYLAGELESQGAAKLHQHLESCARCAAMAEELAETQALVERVLRTSARAPLTLDGRVMAAVRRHHPLRGYPAHSLSWSAFWLSRTWMRRLAAVSGAVALLIGGYLAGHWRAGERVPPGTGYPRSGWRAGDGRAAAPAPAVTRQQRPTLSLALLGEDHLEYLANPQPAQVPGPDARGVSRAMTVLMKFPVASIDLQPEGARLLGGRKCQLHGVFVAFLLYDWQGERVSLYQLDARKIALPPLREVAVGRRRFRVGEANGLSYVAWHSGAMSFVMVSGVRPEHLLHLAHCASGGQSDERGGTRGAGPGRAGDGGKGSGLVPSPPSLARPVPPRSAQHLS